MAFTPHECVETRYGILNVFKNDDGAATRSLREYGEWAQNEIEFLGQFIRPGSTVVDVGAYIGTHTLGFQHVAGSTGLVIAVEAQPASFALLEENVACLPASSVRVIHAFVSSNPGTISVPLIDVESRASFGSTSVPPSLREGALDVDSPTLSANIPAITIDFLNLESCSVVKADVEGVESHVIAGATQTLARCQPLVYCECNALSTGLDCVNMLRRSDYRVFAHVVDAFNPDNYKRSKNNIFQDGREVAIVGVPKGRMERIANLSLRPIEKLVEVKDADDLALALLNKPQYFEEVLACSRAAQSGGQQFLDRYRNFRAHANSPALYLKGDELHQAHLILQQRDLDIQLLQKQVAQQSQELIQLHSLLAQRDQAIKDLQERIVAQNQELSRTLAFLGERDNAIAALHRRLSDLTDELAKVHADLSKRDGSIIELQSESRLKSDEISHLHSLLKEKDAHVRRLQEKEGWSSVS